MPHINVYLLSLVTLGILGLAVPWVKNIERRWVINLPLAAILFGAFVFALPLPFPHPDPVKYNAEILRLSELTVILSLTGVGLRINRRFSLRGYQVPLLLASLVMFGCIAATALAGVSIGLPLASAILLGAVLAPTDPVLAGDVQVKQHESTSQEHPVKFTLTAEAGINDGMAFPFVWLAIMLSSSTLSENWYWQWLGYHLLLKVALGVGIGLVMGNFMAWLFLTLPQKIDAEPRRLGMLAVSMTILVYGIAELAHGYGFISVFVAAITFRHVEKRHEYHRSLHNMVEELEHFLITVGLVMLGGYAVQHWKEMFEWKVLAVALIFLFVVRPLLGVIATFGSSMNWRDRWLVAFMGIKGIGSFFYLAFALQTAAFAASDFLWYTTATTVLLSVVIHRFVALAKFGPGKR